MKRLTALLLALCLILSLAACKQTSDDPAGTPPPSETVPPSPAGTQSPAPETQSPAPFTFTRDNFPRLDGSTSTAPLGRAVAAALLGETEEEVSDLISFSRTTNSFRALMAGQADLLIVGEPNASVYDEMEEAGFEASIDTFATDGLIFVVNADNPVDNLTTDQIRAIYAGEITNWKEVGGDDLPITPFQRNEDAGSQALMKKLVMGDTPLMTPPTGYVVDSMMGLMEAVRSYDNSPGAIGYSVYYYANDMQMASGLKILSVDGVAPSADTIRSEEYPHRNAYYVVMAADTPEDSPTARVYRWLLSQEGQTLIDKQGYVSVLDVSAPQEGTPITTLANRISEDPLPELIPSDDYGSVLPYLGGEVYTEYPYDDMASVIPSYRYGLCTADGTILTDPVYNHIYQATWYDYALGRTHSLPVWVLTQTAEGDDGEYYTAVGLAALDGSWYTGMIYRSSLSDTIFTTSTGVLLNLDGETAVMVGLSGRELFRWTADDFLPPDHDYRAWFLNDGLNWCLRNCGSRLYYQPSALGLEDLEGPEYLWLDPYTGEEVPDPETDEPLILAVNGIVFFDGGRCYLDGTTVTIHYDDGTETFFELPCTVESYYTATSRYFLFYADRASQDSGIDTLLCTHDGTVIATGDRTVNLTLLEDFASGTVHPARYVYTYDESTGETYTFTFLNADGSDGLTVLSSNCYPSLHNGLITLADDRCYRLTDLSTGEDLIRIPRWLSRDLPADD